MSTLIHATTLKERANEYYKQRKFDDADVLYSEALRVLKAYTATQPDRTLTCTLHCNRAAARLILEDFYGALNDANAALNINPSYGKAWFRKAAAHQALRQYVTALTAAEECMKCTHGENAWNGVPHFVASLKQLAAHDLCADPSLSTPKQHISIGCLPPPFANAGCEYVQPWDGMNENLLILFHGLGDSPAAFARLAQQMQLPQTAALALAGPQLVPFTEGGRSWFTVFEEDFELIPGRPGELRRLRSLEFTLDVLQRLLRMLWQRFGWPPRSVHLIGFSQGGTVALELAMRSAADGMALGSCVAISASLLHERLVDITSGYAGLPSSQQNEQVAGGRSQGSSGNSAETHAEHARSQRSLPTAGGNNTLPSTVPGGSAEFATPVLFTLGSADQVVPRADVEQSAQLMRNTQGIGDVQLQTISGKTHGMVQGSEEMCCLMQFWSRHLGQKPTNQGEVPPGWHEDLIEVKPGDVSLEAMP